MLPPFDHKKGKCDIVLLLRSFEATLILWRDKKVDIYTWHYAVDLEVQINSLSVEYLNVFVYMQSNAIAMLWL